MKRVAILWVKFGPYHWARFRALSEIQMDVVGVEVAASEAKYSWSVRTSDPRVRTLRQGTYESVPPMDAIRRVWKLLNEVAPDILFVPGYSEPFALAAALWGKRHRRRVILMSDSTFDDHERRPLKEGVKRILVKSLFEGAFVSGRRAAAYATALGISPARIRLGYDVVDNEYFTYATSVARTCGVSSCAPDTLLSVCRLAPEKNLPGLIKSYAAYLEAGGKLPLAIAGDGPNRDQLIRQVEVLGITRRVTFTGNVPYEHLPSLYARAAAMILPSSSEPWGLVVNEAMAARVPVLVSNKCGACGDLAVHGRTAIVFDPSTPESLTQALLSVDLMPTLERNRMIANAFAAVSELSLDSWVRSLAAFCEHE